MLNNGKKISLVSFVGSYPFSSSIQMFLNLLTCILTLHLEKNRKNKRQPLFYLYLSLSSLLSFKILFGEETIPSCNNHVSEWFCAGWKSLILLCHPLWGWSLSSLIYWLKLSMTKNLYNLKGLSFSFFSPPYFFELTLLYPSWSRSWAAFFFLNRNVAEWIDFLFAYVQLQWNMQMDTSRAQYRRLIWKWTSLSCGV